MENEKNFAEWCLNTDKYFYDPTMGKWFSNDFIPKTWTEVHKSYLTEKN